MTDKTDNLVFWALLEHAREAPDAESLDRTAKRCILEYRAERISRTQFTEICRIGKQRRTELCH